MDAYFGNKKIVEGAIYSPIEAKEPFSLTWSADPNLYYTVLILDGDAPFPSNPINSPYLHYLQTNVKGNDVTGGHLNMGYEAPGDSLRSASPVSTSAENSLQADIPHRYVISVFRQSKIINLSAILNRAKFDWQKLVRNNQLDNIYNLNFLVQPNNSDSVKTTSINSSNSNSNSVPSPTTVLSVSSPVLSVQSTTPELKNWFKSGHNLDERQEKYCRCILKAATNQPSACLEEKAWFQKRDGKTCYNPYAVCAKNVGTTSGECGENYDFDKIPDEFLEAYASLNKILVPRPYNRNEMLKRIKEWKSTKYSVRN